MNKTQIWKQASEVFADISELSPKQALAHLHGITNITQDVREAVITLINAGSQASQYFQDNITPGFDVGINNFQNFQTGQQLDEYELLEEIGHGGMSQVFKAKRINTETQTHVAIKVFAPKDNSKELLNHFLNEQKILAGLSHPNIVKMLHSGRTDDSITYLVMELIEGAQPLDKFCRDNKLTINQKIHLITQCAQALSYSHANLIIHRDLKPDNILINQGKQLKIVDFGIAKLINNDLSGNKTTIMALTPSYAAPEQINSGFISIKTDIFSLAVVALDLLTTQNPLPKDRLVKSCANDEQHIDNLLKKLKIDKDLKNILNKALEQEPNKRYSSMQSFADDLNNYLQKMPVNATAQSWFYRVQKFAKRRAALFATMVSFVLFLLVGSVLGYQQYQQIKIESEKAQIVQQFMLDSFEVTDPDNTQGVDISTKDMLKLASDNLNNDTAVDTDVKFALQQTLGLAYGKLGSYTQAIDLLKQSLTLKPNNTRSIAFLADYLFKSERAEALNTLLGSIELSTFSSYLDKARVQRVQVNRFIQSSDFRAAHELLNQMSTTSPEVNTTAEYIAWKRLLAKLYLRESNFQTAIDLLTPLLVDKKLIIKKTTRLGIRNDLANLYNRIGETELSIEQLIEIIKTQRKILGNNHPELISSMKLLSHSYNRMGKNAEAVGLIDEAYQISKGLYGENSLLTANILNDKARILRSTEQDSAAIEIMYKVIATFENQKIKNYQDISVLKINLAQLLNETNKNEPALTLAQAVYTYQKENLGFAHFDTIFSQQILARILSDLGRIDEALTIAKIAMKSSQVFIDKGIKSSVYVKSFYTLATIYQKDKQYTLAIDNFLKITEGKLLSPDSANYAVLTASIAKLYEEINDFENAQKYYLKAIKSLEQIYGYEHKKTIETKQDYAQFLESM